VRPQADWTGAPARSLCAVFDGHVRRARSAAQAKSKLLRLVRRNSWAVAVKQE
jgi:hypothetical protein